MTRQEYATMTTFERFMYEELPKLIRAIEALKED